MKSAVFRRLLHFILIAVALHRVASAADEPRAVSFRSDIAPLLQRRCAACHCEDSAKGGYRLDSFDRLQKPGDSGDATVVSGKAQASTLFKLLVTQDPDDRMPQKAEALPAEEIAIIERWLNSGALYDGGATSRPLAELVREQHLRPAPAHYAQPVPVTALAFNGDGRRLAAGCDDGAVRLYQGESGTPWFTLRAHRDAVQALATSQKGDMLASGAADGEIIIWSALCWEPSVRIIVKP